MFKRRIRSLIGLDVGTKAVKAVELTWSGGGLVLTGFGYAELPSPDAVRETVARVFEENEFHTRRVVTSVSGKSVIVRYLTMFKMSPDDLRNAIRYEADKYIPFDVDEVVLDCQPFEAPGMNEAGANEMRVLLVACKRALVDEQLRILAGVGLQPEIVDVDVFAVGNAYETAVTGAAGDRVRALVDVGASKTSVNVIRGGASLFTREIHSGGDAFTAAIANRLGLKDGEAEAVKRRPGDQADRVRGAVTPAVDDLSTEVRLSFEYFENQFDRGVDEVLVSGGGARLVGLSDDLARVLDRPVSPWDPHGDLPIAADRVDVDALREHAGELAVAVGLASRLRKDA